ncbi:MAG: alanine racemase [Fidelibacterota bacterium]
MTIIQPTFLVDLKKCNQNIQKILAIAEKYQLDFRPHFKTHQSSVIGELFREAGITKITVSSVDMAVFFISRGWRDITIAFPLNILEMKRINALAQNASINLLADHISHLEAIQSHLQHQAGVFIEIDTGDHRTGIQATDKDKIAGMIQKINRTEFANFKGFLTHAGHTYHAKNQQEILKIHNHTVQYMNDLKTLFSGHNPIASIGNTPSCSIASNFTNIDEIRPGNFVYYDLTQHTLGACRESEIAVVLAAPVVSKKPEKSEIIVHSGGVHLSKEFLNFNGQCIYGKIVLLRERGWSESLDNCFVTKLSQEHGTIKIDEKYYNQLNIGDVIGILPVHSCMTANLMKENTKYIIR